MRRCCFVVVALALAACATDMPPEPPGMPGPKVETQIVEIPIPTGCGAAAKLGPEPAYAATDAALKVVPHPDPVDRLTERQKLENWLYLTKLLTVDRLQRMLRDREKTAVLLAC